MMIRMIHLTMPGTAGHLPGGTGRLTMIER